LVKGNFQFIFTITEPVRVVARARSNCLFGGESSAGLIQPLIFNPNNLNGCDRLERDSGFLEMVNGNESIVYRVSNFRTFISNYERAELRGFTITGNNRERTNARLELSIDSKRRNDGCAVSSTDDESNNCNNCRERVVSVNSGLNSSAFQRCTGDVVANFKKVRSGITIQTTHVLPFVCCP
jgi:hypothetical protein